jgi:hypothetical protein
MAHLTKSQKGELADRVLEVMKRVAQGIIPFRSSMSALQAIIEGRSYILPSWDFPIWRTLTIGSKSADRLLSELREAEREVSGQAKDIMSKPSFTTLVEPTEVELVRIKVRDLGFTERPTTHELLNGERLASFGLDPCPAEVGPHLAIVYEDQPWDEHLRVVMESICTSDGYLHVFCVERLTNGWRWLGASRAAPDRSWDLGHEILFVRRN